MENTTSIHITITYSKDKINKFVDAIQGKSVMNFQVVTSSPYQGYFVVSAQTDYPAPREDIQGMLNLLMYEAIVSQ